MKEKKKKPTYNMWQNTAYFVKAAWDNCPSVLLICLLLAVVTARPVLEVMNTPGDIIDDAWRYTVVIY